ncbi:golgin subfamily A member 6-like protein 24 [Rhineura floridana]|uniref:golgin subfamily A member 6-like protein 24 n=1 Tax=Rhineura floridana TaxID=261503 RepID=UPI002AC88C5D|nr:golgin subfamily A member 6-like protein 24 [Rhineura floridana]
MERGLVGQVKWARKRHPRKDATVDGSGSSAIPAIVADALANGDQRTPLETRRQLEAINSPLQLEAVPKEEKNNQKEDDKKDQAKEREQKNARPAHGADSEMEKMRLDFELTVLKHQHEENDKQRQHEEKMEHIRQHSPSRPPAQGEEEPLGGKLDPITEIELEKMRMEFELAKLKHISEENERQRQHERKMYEDKEKQRQHEEKMQQLRLRQGSLRVVGPKATGGKAEAETSSEAFGYVGKVRIELQLAMEVYVPEMNEKKPPCEPGGPPESPKLEQQLEKNLEVGKPLPPPEQKNDGVTEHLGLQVPRIVVSGAESEWSSSRLDLAIETELEKRRMEFELTRLKYEHEENERQRQHEEKMEQLRQQQGPPKESE